MKKITVLIILFLTLVFLVETVPAQNPQIKTLLEPYIQNNELAGIVTVIANPNEVIQIDTFGYADIENKRAMTSDTLFWIASQTKAFTAVCVMMLVEEGKISLDEPVTTYLPELKELRVIAEKDDLHTLLMKPEKTLTLRRLLCHTGGMESRSILQQKYGIDIMPLSRTLTESVAMPLLYQPGEKCKYSNLGIDITANVIERVAQIPYEDFLQKRLIEPLGMKDTTFYPTSEQLKRIAKPYKFGKEEKEGKKILVETTINQLTYPLDDREHRFASAAGGLFSTPNDLVRFFQMLAGNGLYKEKRFLSEKSVQEIRTKQTGEHLQEGFGLAMGVGNNVFLAGGAYGTDSRILIDSGLVLLFMIQEGGLPKSKEARDLFQREGKLNQNRTQTKQ